VEWHGSPNFQGLFNQILGTAVDGARLAPEKMISAVFVASGMEFDQASVG
jgi:hypothetical protein